MMKQGNPRQLAIQKTRRRLSGRFAWKRFSFIEGAWTAPTLISTSGIQAGILSGWATVR